MVKSNDPRARKGTGVLSSLTGARHKRGSTMDFDRLNHEASSMGWTFQWTVEEDRPLSPFDPDAPYRWSALLCHAHGNKAIRLSGRASNPDSAHAMATWHLWDALQDIRDADKKRLRKEASEALKSYKRLVR